MSLKQKIERAYQKWVHHATTQTKYIVPSSSNYKKVFEQVSKIKNDICAFADRLDNC